MKKLTINEKEKIIDNLYIPFSKEIVALINKLPNKIREELDRLNIGKNNEDNKDIILNSIVYCLIVRLGEVMDMRTNMPYHHTLKYLYEKMSEKTNYQKNTTIH
jgi:hypothetical protein